MDPASQDLKFAANLTLPRTKYPWEKRAAPR